MAYHIYLVDDDRFLLDLYAVKFKNAGHEVEVFNGGEDLITTLRKGGSLVPDVILIDIIMPGMTGFETLEAMQKENLVRSSKIIFLTNQGQESDIEHAKQLHADGYITKASAIPSEVYAETIRIIESDTAPKS